MCIRDRPWPVPDSTVIRTRFLVPSPTMTRSTVRASVLPDTGSVARTRSPACTRPMGLVAPSPVTTGVSGVKLLGAHAFAPLPTRPFRASMNSSPLRRPFLPHLPNLTAEAPYPAPGTAEAQERPASTASPSAPYQAQFARSASSPAPGNRPATSSAKWPVPETRPQKSGSSSSSSSSSCAASRTAFSTCSLTFRASAARRFSSSSLRFLATYTAKASLPACRAASESLPAASAEARAWLAEAQAASAEPRAWSAEFAAREADACASRAARRASASAARACLADSAAWRADASALSADFLAWSAYFLASAADAWACFLYSSALSAALRARAACSPARWAFCWAVAATAAAPAIRRSIWAWCVAARWSLRWAMDCPDSRKACSSRGGPDRAIFAAALTSGPPLLISCRAVTRSSAFLAVYWPLSRNSTSFAGEPSLSAALAASLTWVPPVLLIRSTWTR